MNNTKFQVIRGLDATIQDLEIVDGHLYFATDSGKIYLDRQLLCVVLQIFLYMPIAICTQIQLRLLARNLLCQGMTLCKLNKRP